MDENDPGIVLSPTTFHDENQDPDFIDEFTLLSPKEQEQEEEDEYVPTLLAREENGYHHHKLKSSDNALIQTARFHSIQWLIKSRSRLGFGYRTAYLSIEYFDRFLSLQSTNMGREWKIRLLMVTCLSLAVKMEEIKIPKLSSYGGGGGGGGGRTEFSFAIKWIMRMEFRVLNALRWEMRFVSPFPFIPFFLRYLLFQSQSHRLAGEAFSRAAFIVFQAATVISTTEYNPSVVAMAATLVAMDASLSKAAMAAKIAASRVSSFGFSATPEQVYSCYEMIKKKVILDDRAFMSSPSSSGSS